MRSSRRARSARSRAEGRVHQLGVRLHVLPPGEPNGLYHPEDKQEDFLVLAGECLLLVEGEERRLRASTVLLDYLRAAG